MIIVHNWRNFILIRPRSVFKILLSQLGKCVFIQVQNLICNTLSDHVAEVHEEFFDLETKVLINIFTDMYAVVNSLTKNLSGKFSLNVQNIFLYDK